MLQVTHQGKIKGMQNQKWFSIAGYSTNIPELAKIFEVDLGTLRARIGAGWYIPAALLATRGTHWTKDAINKYAEETTAFDAPFLLKMQSFFQRPPVL